MVMISEYVREQKRYTKGDLQRIFRFASDEIAGFIRLLISYNLVKTVKNNIEQRELSDLVEEDLVAADFNSDSDDFFYVFTYVGIIKIGSRIIKCYPKYIQEEKKPLQEMKQVLKVISKYDSKQQTNNSYNGNNENNSYNLLGIILFLISDYHEYGAYNKKEKRIEVNGDGGILWDKTVNESLSFFSNNRPYYIDIFTGKSIDDAFDFFKRLHECILTECTKQLEISELLDLFDIIPLHLSEEKLDDFGSIDYLLYRIQSELSVQFNTRKQILLKTMYAYVLQHRAFEDYYGISMYGTNSFNLVWEDVCAEVFDNKLHTSLGHLNLPIPLNDIYDSKNTLLDVIQKPIWGGINQQGNVFCKLATHTLIPDLIALVHMDGKIYRFVIMDAKYYNIQLKSDKKLSNYPGVESVTKQYLYQLAYKDFLADHGIKDFRNCFLMPNDGDEIIKSGFAKMEILSTLGLKDIQVRLLPASAMFDCYLSGLRMDVSVLSL